MTLQNKNTIPWKTVPICTTLNGLQLKGVLKYWSKDYVVYLYEPIKSQSSGSHLMFMLPLRYTVNEAPLQGITDINILSESEKILVELYQKNSY